MSEYIERGAAIKVIQKTSTLSFSRSGTVTALNKIPAADVVEVKHAEWEKVIWWQHQNRYECNECSLCGCRVKPKVTYNYCPNCGAKMRGDGE